MSAETAAANGKDTSLDVAFKAKLDSIEGYLDDITSPEFYKKKNYKDYLIDIQTFDGFETDPKNVNDTIGCAVQLAEFY